MAQDGKWVITSVVHQLQGPTELQGSLGKVLEPDAQEGASTSLFCRSCQKEESCAAPGAAAH